jgi:beta-galactosidase/beta-glucuronidase
MSDSHTLTPGYRLNSEKIRRALYRLAAAVMSFDRLGRSGAPLEELREGFADDELAHLLVETALANRLQLEHMLQLREDASELRFQPFTETCGVWEWEDDHPAAKPLDFREASNKIIHADEISLVCVEPETLYLKGRHAKSEWKVTIPIQAYIETSIKNFEDALG